MPHNLYPGFPVGVSRRLRFCIEALDDPLNPRRSGLWSLWQSGIEDDAYLTARGAGGSLHVSLHHSGRWRWGFTSEFAGEAERRGFVAQGADRAQQKWQRPASSKGWTHATTIYFPARDATAPKATADKPNTFVIVAPPKDHLVAVHVWITDKSATRSFPGRNPEHAIVAGIPLPSGSAVVITAEQTVMTLEQQRDIDAAVLRAASVTPPSALGGPNPDQLRLTLFLADEVTGEARFIDLDARRRLDGVRRHLAADR